MGLHLVACELWTQFPFSILVVLAQRDMVVTELTVSKDVLTLLLTVTFLSFRCSFTHTVSY